MNIYTDHNGTNVAVCLRHKGLAVRRGWSFLEWRQRVGDWPCWFETELMRAA